jgi:hypothetical protein
MRGSSMAINTAPISATVSRTAITSNGTTYSVIKDKLGFQLQVEQRQSKKGCRQAERTVDQLTQSHCRHGACHRHRRKNQE